MPCADMEIVTSLQPRAEFSSNHDEHSDNKERDFCSPFCICSCCGLQMTSFPELVPIDFPIPFQGIKIQLPTYKSIFSSSFYGSIWQPPQIV
ncbi:hypothetical protein DBR27_16090 [Flavobacterium sp. HMWF030]|nr:hypothetical protein DBR27_16090 [Flavobacterium sp. HMWF030]